VGLAALVLALLGCDERDVDDSGTPPVPELQLTAPPCTGPETFTADRLLPRVLFAGGDLYWPSDGSLMRAALGTGWSGVASETGVLPFGYDDQYVYGLQYEAPAARVSRTDGSVGSLNASGNAVAGLREPGATLWIESPKDGVTHLVRVRDDGTGENLFTQERLRPTLLAADGFYYVMWQIYSDEMNIERVAADGSTHETIVTTRIDSDLVIAGGSLFWYTEEDGFKLYRAPLSGGEPTLHAEYADVPEAIAADDSFVYVLLRGPLGRGVAALPVDGGDLIVLAKQMDLAFGLTAGAGRVAWSREDVNDPQGYIDVVCAPGP
jgi:hypothetical protein